VGEWCKVGDSVLILAKAVDLSQWTDGLIYYSIQMFTLMSEINGC